MNQDNQPIADQEELNTDQLIIEALYLGLRQADGLDLSLFLQQFHIDFKLYFHTTLDKFEAENWIDMDAQRCKLTLEGMLFLDRIVDELIEHLE